jgi:hypothetical protein
MDELQMADSENRPDVATAPLDAGVVPGVDALPRPQSQGRRRQAPEPEKDSTAAQPKTRKKEEADHENVIEIELIEIRKTFTGIFKSMLILIFISVIITLVGIVIVAVSRDVTPTATEKALVVQLIQVGYGMFLGVVCVFLGVMVSWLGITSAYAFGAKGKSGVVGGDLSLKSSSPGIVLMVGGIILIALSLFKPIKYGETIPTKDTKIQGATPTR